MIDDGRDSRRYPARVNHEKHYSNWFANREIPAGSDLRQTIRFHPLTQSEGGKS